MGSAVKFRQLNVPRQKGELARIKVVQGPDYGAVYVILGNRATVGRGEENDIILSDLKSSRVHAEFIAIPKGWAIKDKGSSNGILHNSVGVREARIKIGDTITLGETTLEFITSEAGTLMLTSPPKTVAQLQENQKKLEQQKNKVRSMGLGSLFSGNPTVAGVSANGINAGNSVKKPISKFRILVGAGAVVLLGLYLVPEPNKPRPKGKKKDNKTETRDLASFLPSADVNKTAESVFKEGFREYLSGNLSRARTQFETVLQISPGHQLAMIYLEKCTSSVEEEVKLNIEQGKRAFHAGKLRDSKVHFKRVMRLLNRDRSSHWYVEAKSQCEDVEKLMEIKSSTCDGDKS